ncbi:MAG: cysteine desulfurase [Alphaproteobacteria bacterium]|nr:MAG: cysteine desulfurase [Alphaproteobacteria bacterium]
MSVRVYLDWNASAPLRPEAHAAACAALALSGNPSSVHGEGRAARRLIEQAREDVAALVGAEARNVIFTSGGTEANALALSPMLERGADKQPFARLLISAIEHPSVRAGGRFAPGAVTEVPVRSEGVVDLDVLERSLASGSRALVSLMAANNETGVVQPIAAAAEIVHRFGGLLHVDAVQAAGRMPLDINALGADLLTLSAHKIGGAKGAGALIKRAEALHFGDPLIKGGGQERGARAGTENVAAIAAFGAAAAAARNRLGDEIAHMAALRERLEAGLRALTPEAVIFGADVERLPNTTLVTLPGAKAETLVIGFDLEDIAVSSGAACSSGKVAPSHVLAAMGIPRELARGAIRASTGAATTTADIDQFLEVWKKLVQRLSIKEKRGLAA